MTLTTGVVITGTGLVSPLGCGAPQLLGRIGRGETAASRTPFDAGAFACPLYAPAADFDAARYFPNNKTLRLMNRDAQMAVVAARLAAQDAGLIADETYPGERIALFGATGLSSLPAEEISSLVRNSAAPDGSLDLGRFGQVALKRVRPVLSFKILANMPICFVSIFENIRGENAVYAPWEGQGAQAIAAGLRAIRRGAAPCALVGGCDVKTHEFSFISLQQLGGFDSWRRHGRGSVPGEGAAFLVLEAEQHALARGARIYARIRDCRFATVGSAALKDVFSSLMAGLNLAGGVSLIAAGDGEVSVSQAEEQALEAAALRPQTVLRPKAHLGNLFAAAAAVQVGLAAEVARRDPDRRAVLANCFGHGSEQAAFVLEAV